MHGQLAATNSALRSQNDTFRSSFQADLNSAVEQRTKELTLMHAHLEATNSALRSQNDAFRSSFQAEVNTAVEQRTKELKLVQTQLETRHTEEIERLESKVRIIDDYTHRSSAQKGIDGESRVEDIIQGPIACEITNTARVTRRPRRSSCYHKAWFEASSGKQGRTTAS